MAKRHSAAIRVDLRHVELQISRHSEGLCRKCLVRLDDVHVVDGQAGLLEELLAGSDRADAHDGRIHAAKSAADEGRHRLHSQFLRLLFGHDDHCCSTVVDSGSVSCSHDAVLLEGGFQLRKGLNSGSGARALVLQDLDLCLLHLDSDRNDLIFELSCFDRRAGLLLALRGEVVQFFSGEAVFLCNVLGGDAHVVVVERIPKTVVDHDVDHVGVVHSVAETCLGQGIGSHGHVLHTACHDDVSVARFDHLCRHVDAVQTGTADDVHGDCGGGDRKAGLYGCLSCRVLSECCLKNITHVNMVYLLRSHARSLQSLFDHNRAEFDCGGVGERSAHLSDRGTACSGKDNFLSHKSNPPYNKNEYFGIMCDTAKLYFNYI